MSSSNEGSSQANRSTIDPIRFVVIALLLGGAVLTMFLSHVLEIAFSGLGLRDAQLIEGLGWKVSSVVGFFLALSACLSVFWVKRAKEFASEVATELMRVRWPTGAETRVSTTAVIITSLVAAVILAGMDSLAYNLMVDWLPKLWGKL